VGPRPYRGPSGRRDAGQRPPAAGLALGGGRGHRLARGCLYGLRDGRPQGGPARAPLAVRPARIIGGRVQVVLPG
ncbi:MAG: hypothetical protein ACK446_00995, partial [Rhodobacterales bacterium]